jgi:hypothetical protein
VTELGGLSAGPCHQQHVHRRQLPRRSRPSSRTTQQPTIRFGRASCHLACDRKSVTRAKPANALASICLARASATSAGNSLRPVRQCWTACHVYGLGNSASVTFRKPGYSDRLQGASQHNASLQSAALLPLGTDKSDGAPDIAWSRSTACASVSVITLPILA